MRLLSLLLLLTAGCRDTFAGFGVGQRARAGAGQLFGALADRHQELVRNGRYDYARGRLTQGALSPSKVFDDSSAWTALSGPVRLLEVAGSASNGRYYMSARSNVPAPMNPADARHVTTLSRLADDQYRWETAVDFALGSVEPADIGTVIGRLLTAGEGHTEREARAALVAASPRSSTVLGSAFSLDTLRPVLLADGSTAVTMTVAMHSSALAARYPALAGYLHKYLEPARAHIVVTDRGGALFLDALLRDQLLTVHLRSHQGHLVPLNGPARPMPDSLQLLADFTMKVKLFTVGFHDLRMDLVNFTRGDSERAWVITAQREPSWNLPFISARLLRAPLRRPFAGEGALFRIGVRAGAGKEPTVLYRQARLNVQQSAILDFINGLSSKAVGDLNGAAEREQYAFTRELFLAMRGDALAALAP